MDTIEHSSAVTFVRDRLAEEGQSMTAIARATGVSKRWLELMRSGDIPNPGIENLSVIAKHFGHEIVSVPAQAE